ncbi:N,N-dimethylformamidase beta subunit family domain-containing protein [Streptomyces sp. NPDC002205]|uniref:N,N-dimethylformamidase beta subunit family domain-containing protein n=1 Tax=Streptomyces sp. NPDC002205 TaxID=3154411 RepID=UPI00331B6FFD
MSEQPASPAPRPRYAWSVPGWRSEHPDPSGLAPEIWCYTDHFSYAAGGLVDVHVHTTADRYSLRVVRDGAEPREVYRADDLPGRICKTPEDSYATGCDWPVALTVPTGADWSSGLYLVIVRIEVDGRAHEREHFFVLRAAHPGRHTPYALVLTTSTMTAYNDWGGANCYRGIGADPYNDIPSPLLSTRRPIARGMLRKPADAPRSRHSHTPPPDWIPRHENYEWALGNGYSRHHADAFWATYERPFVVWAEQQGYRFDYLTQHDLHFRPELLDHYRCAVIVGHDEYWSWEMRDAVDRFTDAGGNLARFAGNFFWQIRLDEAGTTQTCYKDPRLDPLLGTDPERVTTCWDSSSIGRPGAQTMGLTGLGGGYSRYGNTTPRSSGGFTVYRPDHWALHGTDLYYGDVIGAAPVCVASFEVDGVEYAIHKGLPYATGEDGAPENLEILAMAPVVLGQLDKWGGTVPIGAPANELDALLTALFEDQPPEYLRGKRYGSAMIATFSRGSGTVFNAGSCEWVNGLIHRDPFTERITRNVLDRFATQN